MRGTWLIALLSIFVLFGSQWRGNAQGATLASAVPSVSTAAAQEMDDAQDSTDSAVDGAELADESDDGEDATSVAPLFPHRLGLVASDGRGTLRIDPSTTGRPLLGTAFSGKVDLAALFPHAGRQSDQDSCVAWAVAYVRTYYEIRDGRRSALDPPFSPSFVYNQCNGGADNGCTAVDALRVVQNVGLVPMADFPYDPGDFQRQPDASLLRSASALRIAGFGRLWEQGEQPSVTDLRQSLATGDPVILGVSVYDDDSWALGPLIDVPPSDDPLVGGHAVVAVGFDDDAQLFKIANTWGDDWGENGYGYLTYAYVDGGYAPEAWVMVPSLAPLGAPEPGLASPPSTPAPTADVVQSPAVASQPDASAGAFGTVPIQPLPLPLGVPGLDAAPPVLVPPGPAPFAPTMTPTLSPSPTVTASPTPTQGSSTSGSSPSNAAPSTGAPDQQPGQGSIHRAAPTPANTGSACSSQGQCQNSGPKK